MLQCGAACCSVLPRVAVCCSMLWCTQCLQHVSHVSQTCELLQCVSLPFYSVLQCVAVRCSMLQCVAARLARHANVLQPQHIATHWNMSLSQRPHLRKTESASHCVCVTCETCCNALQHTATYCNALQHTVDGKRDTLQRTATHYHTLRHKTCKTSCRLVLHCPVIYIHI